MKEEIQALVSQGRTEEALKKLAEVNQDAILLQARFASAKKQSNMGLIEFSEWSRIQNQINFALLELAGNGSSPVTIPNGLNGDEKTISSKSNTSTKKVFISYNHNDKEMSQAVKNYLEDNGCDVTIDVEDMMAGELIQNFIQDKIKENEFIISIVSANSLQSSWVGKESTASFFGEFLSDKKFIPVAIDQSFMNDEFYLDSILGINKKIKDKEDYAKKLKKLGSTPLSIQNEIKRLSDLKSNFDDVIQRLKSGLTVDISGSNFEDGMAKVLKRINN
jgi:hypothetical protein